MNPLFITALISIVVAVLTLGQVTPSVSNQVFAKNVEISVGRESALMQQIVRYRGVEGVYPSTVTDLVAKGYWRAADNDNGFGGKYTFTVDPVKSLVTINTTIADASRRTQYFNSYKHVYKPLDSGSGAITTTFVMPSPNSVSSAMLTSGSIPVSSASPDAATNTYWYDTSSGSAILKVSNGASWMQAILGSGGLQAPSSTNIVNSVAALPSTASVGDVRYIYDATTNTVSAYVYYNGLWAYSSGGVVKLIQYSGFRAWSNNTFAASCKEYKNPTQGYAYAGATGDGIYRIGINGAPYDVYCDMMSDGGGWTVIQNRYDGKLDFYRSYAEYAAGFGSPSGEHWLGNDKIAALTATGTHELRVDLSRTNGETGYAKYSSFKINSAADGYRLTVSGPSGNIGDSLSTQNGNMFSTYNVDQDTWIDSCAQVFHGAWWYSNCHASNLNGAYLNGPHASYADGMEWSSWAGAYESMKTSVMKVR